MSTNSTVEWAGKLMSDRHPENIDEDDDDDVDPKQAVPKRGVNGV